MKHSKEKYQIKMVIMYKRLNNVCNPSMEAKLAFAEDSIKKNHN